MPPSSKSGVFISYARSDGETLAAELRARLEAQGVPLWRDREHMEGGRDWWLQITAALDAVEFMVLVMTPAAMSSALVRREWRYARQRGICVYPVRATPDLDFESLPRWMRSVHFYDLDREWPKLLNDLRTRCERRRVPFMVEDLPPEFVPRPAEIERLVSHILDRAREEPIAITAALRAAGGYGKTVLARAVCHHEDVQNAFDDGILWVTLGENPGDLTARVEDLIYLLSGQRPGFTGLEAAVSLLAELLADRDILMVLDDVWDPAHAKPFLQGGQRCARIITTRNADAVPPAASRLDLGPMVEDEAVALLGYGTAAGSADLRPLAARLGGWPLLLNLANAALRDRVRAGQAIAEALAYITRALDRRGVTFFDARDPAARHQAVSKTVGISVERLAPRERDRFAELAVFPEDADIPLTTLVALWRRTGGLDDLDTEQLCDRLNRLSLAMTFDPAGRFIRLHDVIRRLLIEQRGDRLPALHRELVDAHRPPSGDWADMPLSEPYLWDYLAYHLRAAGRGAELLSTVTDLRYLTAQAQARGVLAAERDLLAAEAEAPDDATVRALRRSFVQSSHILSGCRSAADLAATLHGRLQHVEELGPLTAALAPRLAAPYVRAAHPLPDLPHPALVRTMSAGTAIWSCAVSPDASFIVSAGNDGAVIIWDGRSGAERRRLLGHTGWVRRCAVSPDGAFLVSASYDRRLRIWDAATGDLLHVLAGHTDGVTDCAVSPDATFIVSASHDETLRVWDVRTGALRQTLAAEWREDGRGMAARPPAGHTAAVWGCAISPDGRLIASASSDHTLRLWDARTGREVRTFAGHVSRVNGCQFSPDGRLLASAGADATVRVWDVRSGSQRLILEGHTGSVNRCAFLPDGRALVSASSDRTVRIWDAAAGAEQATCYGHTDWVNDCAAAPGGSFLVSASEDATLRVWDPARRAQAALPGRHRESVNGCAVDPSGRLAATASADATLKLWDVASGAVLHTFAGHDAPVHGCAFVPRDDTAVTASADRTLKVWNARSGRLIVTLAGHKDWVNACCVSPDGRLVASASSDRTLRVWDGVTWIERLRIVAHGDAVNACAFSPDGAVLVSASTDTTLKVWDVATAREIWESDAVEQRRYTYADWHLALRPIVLAGHTRGVNGCAISPDGGFIVSASSDHTLGVWDISGGLRMMLRGHRDDVNGCAVSPDGRLIASVSDDRTLCIWDAGTGACLTAFHVDGALAGCAWCADGERLIAVGAGGVYFLALVRADVGLLGAALLEGG